VADLTVKRHDHGRERWFTITDANGPVDLTEATTITLIMKSTDISPAVLITLAANPGPDQAGAGMGRAFVVPDNDDFSVAGSYSAEAEVLWSDGSEDTFPNGGYRTVQIVADLNAT